MAWATPRTWVTGELVTASLMNTHLRDQLSALLPVDQVEWDTWSPSLTNLTLGNGTVAAKYTQIGKTVIGHFIFTLGSTSAVGTTPSISTPVTCSSLYSANLNSVGSCQFAESGALTYGGSVRVASTTSLRPVAMNASATHITEANLTATLPFTWGTADTLAISFCYEAA